MDETVGHGSHQGPCGTTCSSLQAHYIYQGGTDQTTVKPNTCHLCGCQLDVSYFYHYSIPSHTPWDPEHINFLIHGSLPIFEYAIIIIIILCIHSTHTMPFLAFCLSTLKVSVLVALWILMVWCWLHLPRDVSLKRLDCHCVASDSKASALEIRSALFWWNRLPVLDTKNASDVFLVF